ncbi:MAG TPA: 4-(cytidine 5'-diphospho)-2-C-methyl-D-erythritol kinase [Rubrobacteraceae bacterium]|nr:4-(cytidine 5'-diphospho)-2-C-methyl-D-erythritol kinase [Rubrobacteraceae bacterium]
MRGIHLRAFAKVNYALDVLGVREDGYHEISTVMQSVSLADEVEITRAEGGLDLRVEPEGVEVGPLERNTIYRAWTLLRERTGRGLPVRVRVLKKIPAGAGLGGGSADAAAALIGLNRLFDLGLEVEDLAELGVRIGADVPFCLTGGTALGEGVGEVLTALPAPPQHFLVIAKPAASADTGEVYRAYDELPPCGSGISDALALALRSGDLRVFAEAAGNDLARVTRELVPEVENLERALLQAGALGVSMTGTGTAVYGIFANWEDALAAADRIETSFASVFEPVSTGVEEI